MNRGRISISVFLCFLIMMFLVVIGCSSGGGDAPAPSPTYTVTFDSQSATVAAGPTSKTVTSPATTVVALPTAPTKTNYYFAGWWTATGGSGTEFTATTAVTGNITVYAYWSLNPVFTQANLVGTWRMNMLKTGTDTEWDRARITIDSSGVATCLSVDGSFTGGNICPSPFDLTFKMDTTNGVITQTGANAANAGTGHMTMTSNKNFVVGTGTNGTTPNFSYQLMIAQKEVTGTSYSATDVQNISSFVYHTLQVGATNKWKYGTGSTNTTGALNINYENDALDGESAPGNVGSTISVDSSGVVTMSGGGMNSFQGFLSSDKKTIVGTLTEDGTKYRLMIFQITGQTYTAGTLPAGISASHMLTCGSTPAPFWLHYTSTVDGSGHITFTDWVSSNSGITNPGTTNTGHISSSGTVTIDEKPTYHGQVSDDGKFTVAIQTNASGIYSLGVSTK